jgi:hypothetical protein
MRNFERAFADMAHAKRLGKTGKDKPRTTVARAPEKPPAPVSASPVPPLRWRMTAAVTP